ncbi:transcriptional regulator [Catenovulum sp. SM1970]|uniref:helix-turn-helix domain-containing protein n=1 Tax=Marinifaba aquimaris TaxID=2741323 RepID=UPI00157449DA|nr:helix-turn-helix domain-containing protein [Marinifaba aquimaris]NTS76832.1 transcriptional regulator [Marinifaba aquimaris]
MDRFIQDLSELISRYQEESGKLFAACATKIQDESDLVDRAEMIEALDNASSQAPALLQLSTAILGQVEDYESVNLPREPHLALKALMKEHKVKQKDLADIATQSIISEILNQKRRMTVEQIKGFAQYFDVPVTTFMQN